MDSLNPYNPFKNKKPSANYSQEQLDYIKQLLDQGWSVSRICSTYNLYKDSIKKRIKNDNWSAVRNRRDGKLTSQEISQIKLMVDEGINNQIICDKFQISETALLNRIQNNKWDPRPGKKNQYSFNEHYFDTINDEHKAYWLGFLMADGYVLSARHRTPNESQSFGFSISMRDRELFDYFKRDIKANNPVNVYNRYEGSFKNGRPTGRILLTSQHCVNMLKSHGVVENKTLIAKMPELPDELIPHFIRGYSDGDGSISIDKNNRVVWGLCGTKEMLNSIQHFFGYNYKLSQRFPERHNNNWQLKITGWKNVPSALDICYNGATIYLKRKYDKYVEIQGKIV